MKWSKVKKLAEDLLADSLRGRIRYHVTDYGPNHRGDTMSRGWITLDGTQVENFSNVQWYDNRLSLAYQLQSLDTGVEGDRAHPTWPYEAKWAEAEALLEKQGIFSKDQFYLGLQEYIQLPIDAALGSPNAVIRAIALMDRRCGRRRLPALPPPSDAPRLVKECYRIRCEAEGLHLTA